MRARPDTGYRALLAERRGLTHWLETVIACDLAASLSVDDLQAALIALARLDTVIRAELKYQRGVDPATREQTNEA